MPTETNKTRVVWVVTPHANSSDFDEWWGPGETDEDHHAALAYAQERLEECWDQAGPEEPVATVSIEQRWVTEEEYMEIASEFTNG